MSVTLSLFAGAGAQFFDNNGNPLSGGKIYTYAAGTTTPNPTYTTNSDSSLHTNPIVLDAAGRVPSGGEIWLQLGVGYKFVVKTSAEVLIATYDNIPSSAQPPAANDADSIMYEQGYLLTAGSFIAGKIYRIVSIGTTDFTLIGATSNTIGTHFIATGVGSGTGTAELSQTVETKLRQTISVKDFGAVGDGVTDDTVAVHAAFDKAKTTGQSVYFPAGKYRVTSGYTNATLRGDVTIFGEGLDYAASNASQVNTSCIVLDSISGASFFYEQTADNQLTVNNMVFACAQYVLDRKFFVTSAACRHNFYNVNFVAVEQPFVYLAGTYFQLNAYRNIRFTNSGSFHSKTTSLISTFMLIENCDVEGAIPANTEKVICNLTGVRQLQATNFLIEPSIPSAGWIALFLQNDYDQDWIRFITATFRGFWIEVTGNTLLYSVYQVNGRSLFIAPVLNNGAAAPVRLDDMAAMELRDSSFSGTSDPLQNYFALNAQTCQVKLTNCNYRNPGSAINDPRFTFDNCSWSPSAGQDLVSATSHNNQQSELLWAFDGGYPDPGKVLAQAFGGTTIVPTVDAAFGRGLYINPSAGALEALFQGRLRGDFPQGGQMFVVVRGTLPNIPSGVLEMTFIANGSAIAAGKVWTPADSLTDFRLALPITAPNVNPTTMGVTFSGSADTAALKLYQLELWIGKSLPSVTMPSFPQNVQTYAASTPAAGQWAQGDIVWNNAPAAGGTPGWVCTTGGTPGTWKAMANLAV